MANKISSVNVIGMGALGMLFGGIISKSIGKENTAFVMDDVRYEHHKNEKYRINSEPMDFRIIKKEDAEPCDLLIVAVKYTGLQSALEVMDTSVGDDTIIISVMNGISSEKIIGARYGMKHMIYTVAQGMDAMHFGNDLTYTKPGRLCIGIPVSDMKDGDSGLTENDRDSESASQADLERLSSFFAETGVPYTVEKDIMYRMWSKFMLNVGVNQTCMVYDTDYEGAMAAGSEAAMTMYGAMREVVLLAQAEGIQLSEKEVKQYIDILKTLDPHSTPSMGQDRMNRHPSEADMFAGTVISMAAEKEIPVPANEFLYRRVHEIESDYMK